MRDKATQAFADAIELDSSLIEARSLLVKRVLEDVRVPLSNALAYAIEIDARTLLSKKNSSLFTFHCSLMLFGTVFALTGNINKAIKAYGAALGGDMRDVIREPDLSSFVYFTIRDCAIPESLRQYILVESGRFESRNPVALQLLNSIPKS